MGAARNCFSRVSLCLLLSCHFVVWLQHLSKFYQVDTILRPGVVSLVSYWLDISVSQSILTFVNIGTLWNFDRQKKKKRTEKNKTVSFSFIDHFRDSHQASEAGVALNYQKATSFFFLKKSDISKLILW